MTPEQKAKAYDEAIKKAVALYKASEPMSGCNVILETLFPELKESEDEKVRKALIDFFGKSAKYGGQTNGVYDKDILAWLERQVEQNFEMKTAEESLGVDSETYNKIIDEFILGEQKPEDKIEDEEYNGEDYGIDSLYHAQRILEKTLGKVDGYQTDDGILSHKCDITAVKKLYEQKPAWSEKDVRVIDDIFYSINEESVIEGLNDRGIMYALKDIRGIVKYLRNWLQDLKRRVQPQHKQEWSEEDEEILRTILSDGIRGAELDMLQVNWLKSLKGRVQPQNHWKPSDEQMMALLYHCSNGSVLTSLYNDLNKLKEE